MLILKKKPLALDFQVDAMWESTCYRKAIMAPKSAPWGAPSAASDLLPSVCRPVLLGSGHSDSILPSAQARDLGVILAFSLSPRLDLPSKPARLLLPLPPWAEQQPLLSCSNS